MVRNFLVLLEHFQIVLVMCGGKCVNHVPRVTTAQEVHLSLRNVHEERILMKQEPR